MPHSIFLLITLLAILTLTGCATTPPAATAPGIITPRHQTTPIQLTFLPTCAALPEADKSAILAFLLRHADAASHMGAGDKQGFSDYMSMFHYPTIRIASGKTTILATPDDVRQEVNYAVDHPFPADYWRSQWTRLLVIDAGPDKVHLATTFNRQRKDGSILETSTGFYILDKVDGAWAIRARSSFSPVKNNKS
jgi:hypothetical protein